MPSRYDLPSPNEPDAAANGARMPCPRCRLEMERVERHFLDRVISLAVPVRRYRCVAPRCGWEGTLRVSELTPAAAAHADRTKS